MRKLLAAIIIFCASPALAVEQPEAMDNLFTITYQEVEQAVGNALADKGVAEKVSAAVYAKQGDVAFSYSKPMHAEVRGLRYDTDSRRWSANIMAMGEAGVISAFPVSGRYEALAEVPVLKRAVRNGEIIQSDNIEIRDVPVSQTRSDTVTDLGSLVGKSPLHYVSASRPVRMHEIDLPPVVKKNNVVQMHYLSPGMEIITSGQALEDGTKGNVINVRNLSSKKIVQAVVDENGSVTVSPPQPTRTESTASLGDLYATK